MKIGGTQTEICRALQPLRVLAVISCIILMSSCQSHQRTGAHNKHLDTSERLVLVPLRDAAADGIRVYHTGEAMTAALAQALRDRRYEVAVAASDAPADVDAAMRDSRATALVTGNFMEWSPDLRLVLALGRPGLDDWTALSDTCLGSADLDDQPRATHLAEVAAQAVTSLTSDALADQPPGGPAASRNHR